jgi:hypothetical protein
MLFDSAQRRAAMLPSWKNSCQLDKSDIDFVTHCCRIMPSNRPNLERCSAWFQERKERSGRAAAHNQPKAGKTKTKQHKHGK